MAERSNNIALCCTIFVRRRIKKLKIKKKKLNHPRRNETRQVLNSFCRIVLPQYKVFSCAHLVESFCCILEEFAG